MSKQYDNQLPYDPEIMRRVNILGEHWQPGLSDSQVNEMYGILMDTRLDPLVQNILVRYIGAGIKLEKVQSGHIGNAI